MSLKIIRTDVDQLSTVTSYYRSIVTMGLSRTIFEIMAIQLKLQKKFLLQASNALAEGFPWNFVTAMWLRKLKWCHCQVMQTAKSLEIYIFV